MEQQQHPTTLEEALVALKEAHQKIDCLKLRLKQYPNQEKNKRYYKENREKIIKKNSEYQKKHYVSKKKPDTASLNDEKSIEKWIVDEKTVR